jgi:hypothetical protein
VILRKSSLDESGNGRFLSSVVIKEGKIVSPYKSSCIIEIDHATQIDITGFTEDCVADDEDAELSNGRDLSYDLSQGSYNLLFQGNPYSGLAFEFFKENCIAEFYYLDGRLITKVNWDAAGNMRALHTEDDIIQSYAWYASGVMKLSHVNSISYVNGVATTVYRGMLRFSEDGGLSSVYVDKKFIRNLREISIRCLYFPIKGVEGFASQKGSESVTLSGDGIDDLLFTNMLARGVFGKTSEILVSSTSVRGTNLLVDLLLDQHINKLRFKSNHALDVGFVKALKSSRLHVECDSPLY